MANHEASAPEHLDMLVMQLTRLRRQLLVSEGYIVKDKHVEK